MLNVKLNKSELQQLSHKLKLYQRLLPSLDLKRRQLTQQILIAQKAIELLQHKHQHLNEEIAQQLPMLANTSIKLNRLVSIESINKDYENVAGVQLPCISDVRFTTTQYSRLATPVWIDTLIERLKQSVTLRMHWDIAEQRLQILEKALLKINQRVNLFEKVLIPKTQATIQRIRLFLSDLDRDAVVRSKLAKSHH